MNIVSTAWQTLQILSQGPIDALMGIIGSLIISFAGLVSQLASTIFEVILNATVIGLGATLQQFGILDGIALVWSAFRDISNIVIIGMFVFVAISMILGNTTYGAKKFVVRILTVAVLINFSLLFTQLVIDVSNLAANQFYKGVRAAVKNNNPAVFQEIDQSAIGQAADTIWNKQGGVAGAFIDKMGVSSFGDTAELVSKISNNGWTGVAMALFFSLTASALLIATAAVFMYGAYLMAARSLLLIFLLATSSLAFAAWLVPKYGEGKYGWNGWLEALIQNAVFAPMLMIMLWASLVILSKAPTGSVGRLLSDPASINSSLATSTIVVYLFTLGMLYLSLKVSSSFSKKITGFNIATAALSIGGRWAGNTIGSTSRFGVRQFEKTNIGKKLASGDRLWGAPGSGQLRGIEKALSIAGGKALAAAHKGSLNPARIPDALSEKYKKFEERYGWKTQGKGGVAEANIRAEAAEKKANEASEKRTRVTEDERKKMLQEAFASKPKVERDTYAQNTQELKNAYGKQEQIRQELEKFRKQTSAGKPLNTAEEVTVKKLNSDLETEQTRIEHAKAAVETFEKSLKLEVDGKKEKKDDKGNVIEKGVKGRTDYLAERREENELTIRFGDDAASRAAYKSWKGKNKASQSAAKLMSDVQKMAGGGGAGEVDKKKDSGTPSSSGSTGPKTS